ncbi:amidohydrolase family protein, partial [Christensenellaceae bacterium OttesenSCG-928-K19]|nr:amidohydrolase family protein [Christensenellaceae bacterium OttesenSCG-928-K19]
HMSSKAGMEAARRARENGVKAYVESCPQYLLLTDERYALPGFEGAKYAVSPPLRKAQDAGALWEAVSSGEVDTIATDHCSFNFKGQKELGKADFSKIPNGAPGVQTRPALLYTYGVEAGKLSLEGFCRLLSENPAKLYGMYPEKGSLSVGSDADIVVWDPRAKDVITAKNQLSACDYTPFEGMETEGKAAYVFVNGRLAAQDGDVANRYLGEYVARRPGMFWR